MGGSEVESIPKGLLEVIMWQQIGWPGESEGSLDTRYLTRVNEEK